MYDYFTHWTSIYLNDELAVIKDLVIPAYIIDFYKNYEPCHQPMTEAGIYLFDLKRIQEENSNSVLLKYKLLTIACTIGGDSEMCIRDRYYAFNNNNSFSTKYLYKDKFS